MIETNNYYPQQRDGEIAAIEDGQPESGWVAEQIGAPVYKVFNGIFWKHLLERGTAGGTPNRIALPVAGAEGPAASWCTGSSSSSDSILSTPVRSPSRGASSPEHRCTARTTTWRTR